MFSESFTGRVTGAGVTTIVAILMFLSLRPASADEAVVKIDNFTFTPATLTVTPGTTVTWENGDDIPHTIVTPTLKGRSKPLDTGDKFSFTFTTAGSFEYFCGLHPHMKGMIFVAP